ncbi:unnamed protein product [Sphenostylis stenocarpa]|uniref:Uncharacterized protein n=1 Tax=Sphenostylis stenocarpa TaxID=92480 RepID=A0AA86SXL2_9FABA|nr:unnamed protein product [Sphenostylis stenocarpa]
MMSVGVCEIVVVVYTCRDFGPKIYLIDTVDFAEFQVESKLRRVMRGMGKVEYPKAYHCPIGHPCYCAYWYYPTVTIAATTTITSPVSTPIIVVIPAIVVAVLALCITIVVANVVNLVGRLRDINIMSHGKTNISYNFLCKINFF